MNRHGRRHAFTLVELLVVIGIIALLISILLPSLNKARQAANFVDCQARLRQMGVVLHVYVSDNKGLLPWGCIVHDGHSLIMNDNLPNASYREPVTWWFFTLSQLMNKRLVDPDGWVRNLSPVFRDKDTIDGGTAPYTIHYTANPRVLYRNNRDDQPALFDPNGLVPSIPDEQRTQRKLTSVKRASDVFVIWDGPQAMDQQFNTYGVAEALDGWGMNSTSGLCFGKPGIIYDRPILPGQLGNSGITSGKALQKTYNIDLKNQFNQPGPGWLSHLRFRHMSNKRLAALCLDGHCETREVSTVMVKDIFTNPR
jgi:prepilin-type N-terminal cleavage/methylation domain-containing protein